MRNDKYTVAGVCSNLLGLETGAVRAGFTPVFACDIEEKSKLAFELLKSHSEEVFIHEDIKKLSLKEIKVRLMAHGVLLSKGELDLFVAGPPCFGMTGLNRFRSVFHELNMLMFDTFRLIEELQPKTAIVEQVPIVLSAGMAPFYNLLTSRLNTLNYHWNVKVLNAANYGCYQSRKRAIFILVRKDLGVMPSFPEPRPIDLTKQSALAVIGAEMYRNPSKNGSPKSGKEMFGTMTSQTMEVFRNGKWEALTLEDRKRLAHMTEVDLSSVLNRTEYTKMLGNMVLPPFAEALSKHVLEEIIKKVGLTKIGQAA